MSNLNQSTFMSDNNLLKSIYIMRDGLPVFHKEYSPSLPSDQNEMLVSGFLSALVSFMKDMRNFGEMRELMTSNNLKFSFFQMESLLFVACTDGNLDQSIIQRFLRNISMKFLEMYNKRLSMTKVINPCKYTGFESIIQREMISHNLRDGNYQNISLNIRAIVPRLLVPRSNIQHEFYFKGNLPEKIIPLIDGINDLGAISENSGVELYKVYAFTKYLVKSGLLSL